MVGIVHSKARSSLGSDWAVQYKSRIADVHTQLAMTRPKSAQLGYTVGQPVPLTAPQLRDHAAHQDRRGRRDERSGGVLGVLPLRRPSVDPYYHTQLSGTEASQPAPGDPNFLADQQSPFDKEEFIRNEFKETPLRYFKYKQYMCKDDFSSLEVLKE